MSHWRLRVEAQLSQAMSLSLERASTVMSAVIKWVRFHVLYRMDNVSLISLVLVEGCRREIQTRDFRMSVVIFRRKSRRIRPRVWQRHGERSGLEVNDLSGGHLEITPGHVAVQSHSGKKPASDARGNCARSKHKLAKWGRWRKNATHSGRSKCKKTFPNFSFKWNPQLCSWKLIAMAVHDYLSCFLSTVDSAYDRHLVSVIIGWSWTLHCLTMSTLLDTILCEMLFDFVTLLIRLIVLFQCRFEL